MTAAKYPSHRVVLNFALFQVGWFACVLGGARGLPWFGALVAFAVVALHVLTSPRKTNEFVTIASVTLFGLVFDSFLLNSGWLQYSSPVPVTVLAPIWIIALWSCFATTLNVAFQWLRTRWLIAGLLGGIGAPLAYLAGASLEAVVLLNPAPALLTIGLVWALFMSIAMSFSPGSNRRSNLLVTEPQRDLYDA